MPRIELERIEEIDAVDQRSSEVFDRLAFAERAVALVRPPRMRVAIRQGSRRVHVEAGRQWGGREGDRWAIVSVPRDASRAAIAEAVLALSAGGTRPWALDVLLHDDAGTGAT